MEQDTHKTYKITLLQTQLDGEILKYHEAAKNASPAELKELNWRIKILEYSLHKYLQIIDKQIN